VETIVPETALNKKFDLVAAITAEMEQAHGFGADKKIEVAVQSFAKARKMAHDLCNPVALKRAIAAEAGKNIAERLSYLEIIRRGERSGRAITVFADSLGLPRPEEKSGPHQGAETCSSWLLGEAFPDRPIISHSQRFFTTDHVLAMLFEDPDLGRGSDVVLHLGLNDCANRMFLEAERISLSLLPEPLRTSIVLFSQRYRAAILKYLPPRHYVPLEKFRSNLLTIAELLKKRHVGKIVLSTIILPPPRSWAGNPDMNRNFSAYNYQIMDVAQIHGLKLLDIDRFIWWESARQPLLPDGMHLSAAGHQLFSEKCAELLR
jgi:lysophospholipase L1-like esterase